MQIIPMSLVCYHLAAWADQCLVCVTHQDVAWAPCFSFQFPEAFLQYSNQKSGADSDLSHMPRGSGGTCRVSGVSRQEWL